MSDRTEIYDKRERVIKLATTYARKASDWLHLVDSNRQSLDLPVSPSYWRLLDELLCTARDIVAALPDDFFETTVERSFLDGQPFKMNLSDDAFERAEKLLALLVSRRNSAKRAAMIERLSNVEGRTPEEAAAFLAKAAELRG